MTFTFNGFKDSQTNLLMPAAFYDGLMKALAAARRNNHPLTLIKFQIPRSQDAINFAQLLVENSRADDLIARMGEREFLILLVNSPSSEKFFSRIHGSRFPTPEGTKCATKSITSEGLIALEKVDFAHLALDLLRQIDRAPHH